MPQPREANEVTICPNHSFCTKVLRQYHSRLLTNGRVVDTHRPIVGKICHCTTSRTATGKFFVSILCQVPHEPNLKTGKEVGIDLGLTDFAVTSDGIRFKNNRYSNRYARHLRKAQKHLSHKTKGSRRYENQRLKVARLHEKIANSRLDNLHKISFQIISNYDVICFEDLNIKGMVKNPELAKHIVDVAWGSIVRMLVYKAA